MRLFELALSSALMFAAGSTTAWEGPDGIISPAPSPGGEEMRAAGDHFERGVDFFRVGNYDAARVEFEAAFALSKAADLLHNLSLTSERQGHYAEAIGFEERFLTAPRTVPLSEREIDETNGRIARLRLLASNKPTSAIVVAPSSDNHTERHGPPGAAIGLMVGGGAMLLVGIGCGAVAFTTARSLENGTPLTMADYNASYDRGQALNGAGIALDVLGGVALSAGAVWAIVDRVRSGPGRSSH